MKIIFVTVLAAALTLGFARLIDLGYEREREELSFPQRLKERGRLRLPLLFTGCGAALWQFDPAYPAAGLFELCFHLTLLVIAITDWEQYIIFDEAVVLLAAAGLGRSLLAAGRPGWLSFPAGTPAPPGPMEAVLTGLAAGGALLLLAVVLRGSIFGGDVKLVGALGVWLGSGYTPSALAIGFLLGGAAALLLLITGVKGRQDYFAYGPYLALGGVIVHGLGAAL